MDTVAMLEAARQRLFDKFCCSPPKGRAAQARLLGRIRWFTNKIESIMVNRANTLENNTLIVGHLARPPPDYRTPAAAVVTGVLAPQAGPMAPQPQHPRPFTGASSTTTETNALHEIQKTASTALSSAAHLQPQQVQLQSQQPPQPPQPAPEPPRPAPQPTGHPPLRSLLRGIPLAGVWRIDPVNNMYEVERSGQVRLRILFKHGDGVYVPNRKLARPSTPLTPFDKDGRPYIHMRVRGTSDKNETVNVRLDVVVARTWIRRDLQGGLRVWHKDGNLRNNATTNLVVATSEQAKLMRQQEHPSLL